MNFISGINATSSALEAEKVRMDIVAENISNAYTTRGLDGKAYQRKTVAFEAMLSGGQGRAAGVRIADIGTDATPGEMIHNPTHPHADKDGMVQMPNDLDGHVQITIAVEIDDHAVTWDKSDLVQRWIG